MVNNNQSFGFLASLGFSDWSVESVSKCLADLGYSSVEWTMAHFHPKKSASEIMDLVIVPEKFGLRVSEVVVQQDFVTLDQSAYEERVSLVESSIKAASNAGIGMLNLFTGPAPWDPTAPRVGSQINEGVAWKLVFDAFQRILPLAEKYHITLAVEVVFGQMCREYYTLMELLHHFDSECLAVNLDPSHYQLYGNDLSWVIHQLAPFIQHVHLKDVVGQPGDFGRDFSFPMLGEGVIDWNQFAVDLSDIGYTGALSVEYEAFNYYQKVLGADPRRAAALSIEQCGQLFPA